MSLGNFGGTPKGPQADIPRFYAGRKRRNDVVPRPSNVLEIFPSGQAKMTCVAQAPSSGMPAAVPPRVLAVLDRSGSMLGSPHNAQIQCVREMIRAVQEAELPPGSFQVMFFNNDVSDIIDASDANADRMVERTSAYGGTKFDVVLEKMTLWLQKAQPGSTNVVLFMTDGMSSSQWLVQRQIFLSAATARVEAGCVVQIQPIMLVSNTEVTAQIKELQLLQFPPEKDKSIFWTLDTLSEHLQQLVYNLAQSTQVCIMKPVPMQGFAFTNDERTCAVFSTRLTKAEMDELTAAKTVSVMFFYNSATHPQATVELTVLTATTQLQPCDFYHYASSSADRLLRDVRNLNNIAEVLHMLNQERLAMRVPGDHPVVKQLDRVRALLQQQLAQSVTGTQVGGTLLQNASVMEDALRHLRDVSKWNSTHAVALERKAGKAAARTMLAVAKFEQNTQRAIEQAAANFARVLSTQSCTAAGITPDGAGVVVLDTFDEEDVPYLVMLVQDPAAGADDPPKVVPPYGFAVDGSNALLLWLPEEVRFRSGNRVVATTETLVARQVLTDLSCRVTRSSLGHGGMCFTLLGPWKLQQSSASTDPDATGAPAAAGRSTAAHAPSDAVVSTYAMQDPVSTAVEVPEDGVVSHAALLDMLMGNLRVDADELVIPAVPPLYREQTAAQRELVAALAQLIPMQLTSKITSAGGSIQAIVGAFTSLMVTVADTRDSCGTRESRSLQAAFALLTYLDTAYRHRRFNGKTLPEVLASEPYTSVLGVTCSTGDPSANVIPTGMTAMTMQAVSFLLQLNAESSSAANAESGSTANAESGSTANAESGSTANVESGSTANVESGKAVGTTDTKPSPLATSEATPVTVTASETATLVSSTPDTATPVASALRPGGRVPYKFPPACLMESLRQAMTWEGNSALLAEITTQFWTEMDTFLHAHATSSFAANLAERTAHFLTKLQTVRLEVNQILSGIRRACEYEVAEPQKCPATVAAAASRMLELLRVRPKAPRFSTPIHQTLSVISSVDAMLATMLRDDVFERASRNGGLLDPRDVHAIMNVAPSAQLVDDDTMVLMAMLLLQPHSPTTLRAHMARHGIPQPGPLTCKGVATVGHVVKSVEQRQNATVVDFLTNVCATAQFDMSDPVMLCRVARAAALAGIKDTSMPLHNWLRTTLLETDALTDGSLVTEALHVVDLVPVCSLLTRAFAHHAAKTVSLVPSSMLCDSAVHTWLLDNHLEIPQTIRPAKSTPIVGSQRWHRAMSKLLAKVAEALGKKVPAYAKGPQHRIVLTLSTDVTDTPEQWMWTVPRSLVPTTIFDGPVHAQQVSFVCNAQGQKTRGYVCVSISNAETTWERAPNSAWDESLCASMQAYRVRVLCIENAASEPASQHVTALTSEQMTALEQQSLAAVALGLAAAASSAPLNKS